jgi:hypothetical protein
MNDTLRDKTYSAEQRARRLRRSILEMALEAGSSSAHIGGALFGFFYGVAVADAVHLNLGHKSFSVKLGLGC